MLKDMVKPFERAVRENKNIILDNYHLKDGLYIKLSIDKPLCSLCAKDIILINKLQKNPIPIDLLNWFKYRDYYSSIINTNKAVDTKGKKIHSSNYLTYFIKKDTLPGTSNKSISYGELYELTEKYYETLDKAETSFIEVYSKSDYKRERLTKLTGEKFLKEYFEEEINYIRGPRRHEKIKSYSHYILSNLREISNLVNQYPLDDTYSNYIKLFFEEDLLTYEKEHNIYTIPRIFNANNYNLFEEGKILGLPSCDMSTNDNKPYLLLKTMKCTVPMRTSMEEVGYIKDFYVWLEKQRKQEHFGVMRLDYNYNFNGTASCSDSDPYYFLHVNNSNEIDDFDNIPFQLPRITFTLENALRIYDWENTGKKSRSKYVEDEHIKDLNVLEKRTSDYFFNGRLKGYYKNIEPDRVINEFSSALLMLFMQSRDAFYDYFHKGVETSIHALINRISLGIIEENLRHTVKGMNLDKIQRAYNLRLSFLKHFKIKGGTELADMLGKIMEQMRNNLLSNNLTICNSDEEFYFTAGQLASFILSNSRSRNRNYGIFEPFLMARNSKQLKRQLEQSFFTCDHILSVDNIKFRNALAMVMGYQTDAPIKDRMKDMLLSGILANNLFYQPTHKESK